MTQFCCPVCGEQLSPQERRYLCPKGHSYDRAKNGYVNLLMSQKQKEKRHGDDALMVRARREFLGKGYYDELRNALAETVLGLAGAGAVILDAGCGECYYTRAVLRALQSPGLAPQMLGVDISREALALGAKGGGEIALAVASVFRLPVAGESCDMVLSVFAPLAADEFRRILKPGGIMIRVVPLQRHLMGLKAAVYDRAYENPPEDGEIPRFACIARRELRGRISLQSGEDIQNLFAMTPYYYKTGAGDQEKLLGLSGLETEIEFGILTYRKQP